MNQIHSTTSKQVQSLNDLYPEQVSEDKSSQKEISEKSKKIDDYVNNELSLSFKQIALDDDAFPEESYDDYLFPDQEPAKDLGMYVNFDAIGSDDDYLAWIEAIEQSPLREEMEKALDSLPNDMEKGKYVLKHYSNFVDCRKT